MRWIVLALSCLAGCGKAPVAASAKPLDKYQSAVLKHLQASERGVRIVKWHPTESLAGAQYVPSGGHDESGRPIAWWDIDSLAKDSNDTKLNRITNLTAACRAVCCSYEVDEGFGDWSSHKRVFIAAGSGEVVKEFSVDDFRFKKPEK